MMRGIPGTTILKTRKASPHYILTTNRSSRKRPPSASVAGPTRLVTRCGSKLSLDSEVALA